MNEARVQFANVFQFSVELAGKLECPPGYCGREHSHIFWELVVLTGDFRKNELYLIPPGELHVFRNETQETQYMIYAGFSVGESGMGTEKVRQKLEQAFRASVQFAALERILQDAFREPFVETDFMKNVSVVLFESARELLFEKEPSGDVVENVKEYIRRNSDRMLTVAEIADSFYFSPKYLGGLFREKTGIGILQYQKQMKMEQAMHRLCDGNESVTEIALSLGYENVQYFSNTFRQYYGFSPSRLQEKKL